MTDDLVGRLRVGDYYPAGDIGYHEISPGKVDALCEQAADRIEALTAEIEGLRKALEEAPIIGLRESGEEFKSRQDNWLKTKAFPALGEKR